MQVLGLQVQRRDGMVEAQGALALNHHDPKYLDRVLEATNGRGPDVILEMLANVNLAKDLSLIARRGQDYRHRESRND